MAARSSFVEALYGSDRTGSTLLAYVAAEHARAALRLERPERAQAPLFSWLGITAPEDDTDTEEDLDGFAGGAGGEAEGGGENDRSPASQGGSAEQEEEVWEPPFARAIMVEEEPPPLPSPVEMWSPRPLRRFNPPSATCAPGPAVRMVSAVPAFALTPRVQRDVRAWVAGSSVRQAQLRRLMVREDGSGRGVVALLTLAHILRALLLLLSLQMFSTTTSHASTLLLLLLLLLLILLVLLLPLLPLPPPAPPPKRAKLE